MSFRRMLFALGEQFSLDMGLSKKERTANLKSNFLLVISALAFYCLSIPGKKLVDLTGIPLAAAALCLCASQFKGLFCEANSKGKGIRALSVLSAIGIAQNGAEQFIANLHASRLMLRVFGERMMAAIYGASVIGALCSVLFLYVALCLFYDFLRRKLDSFSARQGFLALPKAERICYFILLILMLIYVSVLFCKTSAFYAPPGYNFLYTTDSESIAVGNAYLSLAHGENDLRQPLFAVFAAPFIAPLYAVALPFRLVFPHSHFFAMQYAQVFMLLCSAALLARLVSSAWRERVLFVCFLCCSYMFLLFSAVMEQYVAASFYLIAFLFSCIYLNKKEISLFYGAAGTLSTGIVLVPLMARNNSSAGWKTRLKEFVCLAAGYLFLMALFCRGHFILRSFVLLKDYFGYTGISLSLVERLLQYTVFVSSVFFAPPAGPARYVSPFDGAVTEQLSWQLQRVDSVNVVGIAILCLCAASVVLNRKNLFCRIAGLWVLFSFLLLGVMGWGTAENGLILYALYFGWAFAVLLFMLVKWLMDALHVPFLTLAFCAAGCVVLLFCNVPSIKEMVLFSVQFCMAP